MKYIRIVSAKPKIYISGKMSGVKDLNFPAFMHYAQNFRELGFEVLNPAEKHGHTHKSWFWYIMDDLAWIEAEQPEYGFMLRGWQESYGAKIEFLALSKIGAVIIYE